MSKASQATSPRKVPTQARSTFTVEAIFDASVQVLVEVGAERLTTTRIAERAGVSVGTLYQYFPNKQSLLAAVLERHLRGVVAAVEHAGKLSKGQSAGVMISSLVEAFFSTKFSNPEASRALYELTNALGGAVIVASMMQRSQLMLCELLATAKDLRFTQLSVSSYVILTALVGPVQGLLTMRATPETIESTKAHLTTMVTAYVKKIGERRSQ